MSAIKSSARRVPMGERYQGEWTVEETDAQVHSSQSEEGKSAGGKPESR